jgi:hypothetical protein
MEQRQRQRCCISQQQQLVYKLVGFGDMYLYLQRRRHAPRSGEQSNASQWSNQRRYND